MIRSFLDRLSLYFLRRRSYYLQDVSNEDNNFFQEIRAKPTQPPPSLSKLGSCGGSEGVRAMPTQPRSAPTSGRRSRSRGFPIVTVVYGSTLRVSQTDDPMTEWCPMTVRSQTNRPACRTDTPRCEFWNWGEDYVRPPCCTSHLLELASFVRTALEEHAVGYWLDYGPLLGGRTWFERWARSTRMRIGRSPPGLPCARTRVSVVGLPSLAIACTSPRWRWRTIWPTLTTKPCRT